MAQGVNGTLPLFCVNGTGRRGQERAGGRGLRLGHKPGPYTACAGQDTLRGTVDDGANRLEVGSKHPLGFIVRMTDMIADHAFFPTYRTCKRHCDDSFFSFNANETDAPSYHTAISADKPFPELS